MASNDPRVEAIRRLVREGQYRVTLHAEHERDQDRILGREIEEVLCSPQAEVIEDYPSDPRGPHFCCSGLPRQDCRSTRSAPSQRCW